MGQFLYPLFLRLYKLGLWLGSLFSSKIRERWIGSQTWKKDLASFKGNQVIWMHCASLGEFEQGRPILEALHRGYPSRDIVLSFYSPSGYRIRKNYPLATRVVYLPEDSPPNAQAFISALNPSLVFFVKYDLWYYLLMEIQQRKIPAFLIAARFAPEQKYFSPLLRSFYLKMLAVFNLIFTQDHDSYTFLSNIPQLKSKVKVAGDPRFDRVLQQVQQPVSLPDLSEFIQSDFCLIAGSTWPADDDILLALIRECKDQRIRWIIAPHEFSEKVAERYQKVLPQQVVRFSAIETLHPGHKLILIDKVGYLSSLYQYGDLAYIGGGQHHRIHNIQEPAAWGLPLAFGPRYQDFKEACDLVNAGGARVIHTVSDLKAFLLYLRQETESKANIQNQNRNYILSKAGACERIISTLQAAKYI